MRSLSSVVKPELVCATLFLLTARSADGACPWSSVLKSTRTWTEENGDYAFELHLAKPDPWLPYGHVIIEWGDEVQIGTMDGASLYRKSGANTLWHAVAFILRTLSAISTSPFAFTESFPTFAEIELAGGKPSGKSIRISGTGTLETSPDIHCRCFPLPPYVSTCQYAIIISNRVESSRVESRARRRASKQFPYP
jgi:hypothetical protein